MARKARWNYGSRSANRCAREVWKWKRVAPAPLPSNARRRARMPSLAPAVVSVGPGQNALTTRVPATSLPARTPRRRAAFCGSPTHPVGGPLAASRAVLRPSYPNARRVFLSVVLFHVPPARSAGTAIMGLTASKWTPRASHEDGDNSTSSLAPAPDRFAPPPGGLQKPARQPPQTPERRVPRAPERQSGTDPPDSSAFLPLQVVPLRRRQRRVWKSFEFGPGSGSIPLPSATGNRRDRL